MTELIRYEAAVRALAECKAVDEVKDWADKAAAMQAYSRLAKDKSLEVDAAEIRLRAERRLGELLAQQKAGAGLNQGVKMKGKAADGSAVVADDRRSVPTLADAGISKDLSARAQKLAAVPEDEFEQEVDDWRERVSEEGARVTARLEVAGEKALAAKTAGEPKPEPKLTAVSNPEIDELKERLSEMATALQEAIDDNASMSRVFDADDKVAAAMAEAKRFREVARIAESRITGLMNEKNAAVSLAKSLQRKLDKLERAGANLAA